MRLHGFSVAHRYNRGIADFVGPVTQELLEAVTQTSLAVIMVSPGSKATGESWVNRINNEHLALPPVLLCIDHEWLESEELYEFANDLLSVCCSAAEPGKCLSILIQSKRFESPGHVL